MIIGVFSPVINLCGGAEWVAINIITALKTHGHQVVVLSDKLLNQEKFKRVFGKEVSVDSQLIFPMRFFSGGNYRNVYTDSIRSLILKSKCDVLIDTFSNTVLLGMDVSYIHHPMLRQITNEAALFRNKVYFFPYERFLRSYRKKIEKKLILANSKFTAEAIKSEFGVDPLILYPSVSSRMLNPNKSVFQKPRANNVTTIGRIANRKKLYLIPYIAKLSREDITFTIVGNLESEQILSLLLKLIKKLQVADRVKILTNVNREHLRKILLNSKVYLHTAMNEHFGISIVEAMASGCTPIVHNSGGPKEFVPLNQRFNNIAEAADIVGKSIDSWSPAQASKFSEIAERFGENNFSRQFIELLNSHF